MLEGDSSVRRDLQWSSNSTVTAKWLCHTYALSCLFTENHSWQCILDKKKKYGESKKKPQQLYILRGFFEKEVVSEVRYEVLSEMHVPAIFKCFLSFSWQS